VTIFSCGVQISIGGGVVAMVRGLSVGRFVLFFIFYFLLFYFFIS